ncbi:MAG: hypothetical protein ACN2B6_12560 [Rickettsiales bacterium]
MLARIREYLLVGMALISALSVAFATITHLRNENLSATLDQQVENLERVVLTNAANANTIKELTLQRVIDDKLLQMLDSNYSSLAEQNRMARASLEELKRNDSEFNKLLNSRHPVELNRLLNPGSGGDPSKNSKAEATSGANENLRSP